MRNTITKQLGLSAGPIRVDDDRYLIAAHSRYITRRETFFYSFAAHPPFQILGMTRLINFNFSKEVEYCVGMQRLGTNVVLSMGVNDCSTVLFSVSLEFILSRLEPV